MDSTVVQVAAELREKANQKSPAYSTHQIVTTCFPDALVTGYRLPPGVDEAVSRRPDGIVILYRRGMTTPEQRVAIAHAVGHLVYDDDEIACLRSRMRCSATERRADAFAAELLVPLEELRHRLCVLPSRDPHEQAIYLDHVDHLASQFRVPAQLIRSRVRELAVATN
ncbi:MAG: ImmA/IrrE family metallo-endopeptidase [Kofleriaceae bacterium]